MEQPDYLRRLAELDAVVARASPPAGVLVDRAAGMLAGRIGCRFSEAHAYLLGTAADQERPVDELARAVLAGLEAGATPAPVATLDAAVRATTSTAAPAATPAGPEAHGRWRRLMQQVLDGLPGQHSALLPVRDETGSVTEFEFAALTPAVADLSGRRGQQIVGGRVGQLYPTIVGGPVWQAWCETLADGRPREAGPLPYLSSVDHAPQGMSLSVHTWAVGPGLLTSWVRHDEQSRLAERIAQTERLGGLGWGETDLVTGATTWSDELYRIYERDPALGPFSQAQQRALILPEDQPLLNQAAESYARGETVDITYRIRLGGRVKYLRGVADAVRDAQGRPARLYGIVQDVTARETSRARLAEVERQLDEHQRSLAAEHRLAVQLQEIVLPIPAEPIDLAGLPAAVRYRPAEQASQIGGDWFHAEVAEDGAVVLAIGDIAGHGIQAAAVMARVRHALATLVDTTTTDPATLLRHLNRVLYAGGPTGRTGTAVVARYRPASRELCWAQAGHPPPLLARGGHTVAMERPAGILLGAVRHAEYATATLTLEPGDLLLFYTDGLIEQRTGDTREALSRVIAEVDRVVAAGTGRPLADLLAALPPANPHDDTCLLVAGPVVAGPVQLISHRIDRSNLVAVRHEIADRLAAEGLTDPDLYRFVVAINEIMTNAIRHGGGSGGLKLWRDGGQVHCRVTDEGRGFPDGASVDIALPEPAALGGRGLWLARAGSANLAINTGPAGTAVTVTSPPATPARAD